MNDLRAEVERLSDQIEDALDEIRDAAEDEAMREFQYRKARAEAWSSTSGTAKEREDAVNDLTADYRYHRDLAAGRRQTALESLRSRRQQLSACQSLLGADRAEADLTRTSPMGNVPPPRPVHPAEAEAS